MKKYSGFQLIFMVSIFFPYFLLAQTGRWNLSLQNDLQEWIPARISFETINKVKYLNIKNARDTIHLSPFKKKGDTVIYKFVNYNAEIALVKTNPNLLTGYWINWEDKSSKRRPVKAVPYHPMKATKGFNLEGKWKTRIVRPNRSYEAMLVVHQKENILYGTIRTKSGDYRFLEGRVNGNHFYLSSYDGRSIFLLKGEIVKDTLKAKLHGVKSNNIRMVGTKNPTYQLPDSKKLTRIVNDQPFHLDVKDATGKERDFEKIIDNKVTIVSIFGTWCPNCVDEVNYYREFSQKFPAVKIILVAFENVKDPQKQRERVRRFKARKNIDFVVLMGGTTTKKEVLARFPMINNFSAFPTSFLLDKEGKIRSVRTGFNGPATREIYEEFKQELEKEVTALLKE